MRRLAVDVRDETMRQVLGDALAADLVDAVWIRDDGRVQVRAGRWLLARRREQEVGGRTCPWPEGGRALQMLFREEGGTWTNRGTLLPVDDGWELASVRSEDEQRARARARMAGA